ncbi:LacI family DNA-binding transcriptional regulator [uncultured Microbacterium sp.]|uniref:Putative LacI-family transcriptional regulator n=1 Tax=uncultured Microbacterium sp. TaxID=191216 RepID=A0A1Y5P0L1_9MICO|nr:LacI family DNA-binding transcriptional regulator [uncultured Microbacterium sp.]SBS72197.1 putative LacI-family transcriptional regulator [uncultured Microbacterium sp.]
MTIRESRPRPATSLEVAQRAGVSRSTVSNILNGNDARFSPETRERVRAAATELEYRPSPAGRSLVSGRSETIVVLLPNTTFNSNIQDAADEMMSGMSALGGNVVLRFASRTVDETIEAVLALRPLALVDMGVLSDDERAFVEMRGTITVPSRQNATGALPSDGGIGAIQARALLDGGRRELWFAALQDARVDPYGATRFQALRQFCVDEGLPPIQRVAVPLTTQGGTAAVKKMLTSGEPVGVACYNDDVAMAVLAGCRVLTVEVPTALSLVGVDHTPAGRLGSPPLTTIDTDLRGLIHHLADDLRARLGAPPLSDARLPTGFTLVRGGTT